MAPLYFRKSHLRRIGSDSLDHLDQTVRTFTTSAATEMTTLTFSEIRGGQELLDNLKSDYSQLLAEILEENRGQERAWGAEFLQDLALSQSLKVDAFLDAEGGHPHIRISEGLCLALDDALLTALCVLGFFTTRLSRDDVPENYAIGECGTENKDRYFDYSRISLSTISSLPGDLTSHIPLDPVRLAQEDILLSFAVQWVSLHEQAHWLLGHTDWLRTERGWSSGQLDEALLVESAKESESDDLYCLELQADAFATQLLFSYGLSEDILSSRWVSRYREALSAYRVRRRSLAADLSQREDRFQMLLLASSISCLLFELRREKLRAQSGTHPPPATRLLNIFMTAVETWGDVAEFESGSDTDPEEGYHLHHIRPAIDVATRAFVELEMVTQVIGLDNSLYHSTLLTRDGSVAPDHSDLAPLANDFFTLIKGQRTLSQFVTDGGRTYVGLLERSDELYEKLKLYSRNIAIANRHIR